MSESVDDPQAPTRYQAEILPARRHVRVVFNGETVADSRRALVVRETRLPPVFYLPKEDVRMDLMQPTDYRTHCPFKGNASYWTLLVDDRLVENAVWAYENPLPEFQEIAGYVAFYRNRMDSWFEDESEVEIDPVTDTHQHGNPLVDWLLRDSWEASGIDELTARFARQLRHVGIPVTRLNLMVRTLHPQVLGIVHLWDVAGDDVETIELSHQRGEEERFLSSPLVPIFAGRGGIRRRLEGPNAKLDFPILQDLREEGGTDYAAMPITFSDGQIHALTLGTDRQGGFETEHLGHVHEVLPLLARLVEVHTMRRTARTLLDTYLGAHTGQRVLDGLIRRGDGELIPSIIWWADLRGSTPLADRIPRQRYLDLLNEFFECTAGAAIDRGGEVLKFIGDAVLAIFPVDSEKKAAFTALAAARDAVAQLEKLNAVNLDPESRLSAAIALHVGEVNYGNIGIHGRLDFTVTGPAVNEVARLERIGKNIGKEIVTSDEFAKLVPGETRSLGVHRLRGVPRPMEVYTPNELA